MGQWDSGTSQRAQGLVRFALVSHARQAGKPAAPMIWFCSVTQRHGGLLHSASPFCCLRPAPWFGMVRGCLGVRHMPRPTSCSPLLTERRATEGEGLGGEAQCRGLALHPSPDGAPCATEGEGQGGEARTASTRRPQKPPPHPAHKSATCVSTCRVSVQVPGVQVHSSREPSPGLSTKMSKMKSPRQ